MHVNANKTAGFSLVELLVVIAVIAIISSILLPVLAKSEERARAAFCLNNTKQLATALELYADEHDQFLPYNLQMAGSSFRTPLNWVNNVMTWDLSPDNTNTATITGASLGPYIANPNIYRCPSDHVLSGTQIAAGWSGGRIRSYSLNAMVGDVGIAFTNGVNVNNPNYMQFIKMTQILHPSGIFTFLDEHPDSINDGYFLDNDDANKDGWNSWSSANTSVSWNHLPASYHNGCTAFSFADGHGEVHRWLNSSTLLPANPYAAGLPIPAAEPDFDWVIDHMSIEN